MADDSDSGDRKHRKQEQKDTPPEWRIRLGDTVMELTEREVRLGAVSYSYTPYPGAATQLRYVSPVEILDARFPEAMFQVSEDGYQGMKAKAQRLMELRRQHDYKAGPKGALP